MRSLFYYISQLSKLLRGTCPLCRITPSLPGEFCEGCAQDILHSMQHHPNRCHHCQLALPNLSVCADCVSQKLVLKSIHPLFDYVAPLDQLLLRFKNAGELNLARPFAQLMYRQLHDNHSLLDKNNLLIPIPASTKSLKKRGYNPANEFAKEIGRQFKLPIDNAILHKLDTETEQKQLSGQGRRSNTADRYYCAYRCDRLSVTLVDDIMTSGATLDAAAKALMAAGVKQVNAMVIGRAAYF